MNVVVHGARSPTNLEWQRHLVDVMSAELPDDTRVVVLSRGGSPDGQQRQALVTALRGKAKPVAMLTDDLIAGTAITAMRLFNPTMSRSIFVIAAGKNECPNCGGRRKSDEKWRAPELLDHLEVDDRRVAGVLARGADHEVELVAGLDEEGIEPPAFDREFGVADDGTAGQGRTADLDVPRDAVAAPVRAGDDVTTRATWRRRASHAPASPRRRSIVPSCGFRAPSGRAPGPFRLLTVI